MVAAVDGVELLLSFAPVCFVNLISFSIVSDFILYPSVCMCIKEM